MNILKRREPSKSFHRKIHKHHITTCPSRYQHPSNTQNLRRHQEDNVVMLIDTTSNQNFIDRKLVEPLNLFICPVSSFQIMSTDGNVVTSKFGWFISQILNNNTQVSRGFPFYVRYILLRPHGYHLEINIYGHFQAKKRIILGFQIVLCPP